MDKEIILSMCLRKLREVYPDGCIRASIDCGSYGTSPEKNVFEYVLCHEDISATGEMVFEDLYSMIKFVNKHYDEKIGVIKWAEQILGGDY